jgi:hypothetical protein
MLSKEERMFVARAFAASKSVEQFDRAIARKGLISPEQTKEVSDLVFAIATNKPVPKSNG